MQEFIHCVREKITDEISKWIFLIERNANYMDFLQTLTGIFTGNQKLDRNSNLIQLLNTTPEAFKAFEEAYYKASIAQGTSDNLFSISAKEISELVMDSKQEFTSETLEIISRIVKELVAQTDVFVYDGNKHQVTIEDYTHLLPVVSAVSLDEIKSLPKEIQPDLSGNLIKRDVPESGMMLLDHYSRFLKESNPKKKKLAYDIFRQGLDLLDLDNLTYAMIDQNKASMGYWLPRIIKPVDDYGFFQIPSTRIIKVPLPILQLTRLDYMSLSQTTRDIVNAFCKQVFSLDSEKDYFVKTGVKSSKFDFRNAHVSGSEVNDIGEYLLFIHFQDVCRAHYDLSGRNQAICYGAATTTEWVVRDYIPDVENNACIYHGMPLHTEYRVFVDFDTNEVLGVHNYWDPDVMKPHFEKRVEMDPDDLDAKHDLVTYLMNEERLVTRYEENKDLVSEHVQELLSDIDMSGQWSIDIMQNGDQFYLIDMAQAQNSAFYKEAVSEGKRVCMTENWLPDLENQNEE